MTPGRLAVLALAGTLAVSGLIGLSLGGGIVFGGDGDEVVLRRDEHVDDLSTVDDDDDKDRTMDRTKDRTMDRTKDRTMDRSGAAATGDRDNTAGDDGTNGGNNTRTGDHDNTAGDDGTNGGDNTRQASGGTKDTGTGGGDTT